MRVTELTGHPIITIADASELGAVKTVVVDPDASAVIGYRLTGADYVVPRSAVSKVGPDAVMVDDDEDVLAQPEGEASRRAIELDLTLVGSRVLTDTGNEIGQLQDLEFDPESGDIEALVLEHRRIAGDDLVGVGTYAVVVRDHDHG